MQAHSENSAWYGAFALAKFYRGFKADGVIVVTFRCDYSTVGNYIRQDPSRLL